MRLAAIYFKEHEYLFDKPQTVNFGGKYFYTFSNNGEDIIIGREKNAKFVENLFEMTDTKSKVTQLNAIVGQNGAGKSTVLDIIRRQFIESENALPSTKSLFLLETKGNSVPTILRNDFGKVSLDEAGKRIKLVKTTDKAIQTIYYSPHFDYKFNINFDNYDRHDISFDKIIEKDLSELNEKSVKKNGWPYSPNQELLFKNSLRQIEFLSSKLVASEKIFEELFQLPEHQKPILFFRGYDINDEFRNTSYSFREIIKEIRRKTEEELDDWSERISNSNQEVNELNANKYLLKRYLINNVISLIKRQSESSNHYLNKGDFRYEDHKANIEKFDAFETFIFFIKKFTFDIDGDNKQVFNVEALKQLFEKLYEAIDNAEDPKSLTQESLIVNQETAIEILNLQREFLTDLARYYYLFYSEDKEPILKDHDRIEGFINYMPFNKRLSSGEHALLNLFSRLYNFLNENLKEDKFLELKDHYILLLDEADLTFHPTWKKRYVKAILKTIPFFFNELENHPSVQIIFTTHDPLSLSDLPNSNVIYIERESYDIDPTILLYGNEKRPDKTFGANIAELLSDSFFINDSLTGEFATDLIKVTVEWLNSEEESNAEYYKKLIALIDEPIVKRKLAEMYDDKMGTKTEIEFLKKQLTKLEEEIRNKSKN